MRSRRRQSKQVWGRRKLGSSCLSIGPVLLLASGAAIAAPVGSPGSAPLRGDPVAQNFLPGHGDDISLVATPRGVSCVASRSLSIRESIYRDPEGNLVGLDQINRSPASSVQAVVQPGGTVAFRVQLKYSPKSNSPILLDLETQSLDLSSMLEPSRDSLWLADTTAEALAEAFAGGVAPTLRATSSETGREITDRIDPPALDGLSACLATLNKLEEEAAEALATADAPLPLHRAGTVPDAANNVAAGGSVSPTVTADPAATMAAAQVVLTEADLAPALPVPMAGVRVDLVARPEPDTLVSEDDLLGCRMQDVPEELYLGRLTSVSGFFSQTQTVYVAFDEAGQLERAYIPGIFDSSFVDGAASARLSLAADSNVPDQANSVRGCVGDARVQAPLCVYPGDVDGSYRLAECGVLGVFDEVAGPLAQPVAWQAPRSGVLSGGSASVPGGFARWPAVGGGGGGGGGVTPPLPPDGPITPRDPTPPTIPPVDQTPPTPPLPEIPPIPLPAALWLMLGGLASLGAVRVMRRTPD